jgi:glycosyltransferase involved in cell wall biosynthesis
MAPGVRVHHVPAGPERPIPKDDLLPYLPQFALELERRWRHRRPDVVHAHFWMSGIVSTLAARPLDLPVALTFHALGSVKRRHQGGADTSPASRLATERSLVRAVSAILATAKEEIAELRVMGVDPARVHLVPCGVDVSRFTPQGAIFPPRSSRQRVLSIGRLVPRKGVDDAIRMLRWLPDVELLIAGGPPAADLDQDDEARRLRAVAHDTGAADRVTFLGSVARAEVPALLRSADVAVCLTWYEPFGLVPVEAMACGLPIVGSRVGGLVDTIEDQVTGVLVPPQRPDLAARAVRDLLDHPQMLGAMAARGPERVRKHYAWQHVAALTEAVYAGLVAGRDSAARTAGVSGATAVVG